MYSPQDIKYFITVAQNLKQIGGLRLAAKTLNVSQPALTHAMRRLEAESQVQLFERIGRNLKLSKAGESLLQKSESLLLEWDNLSKQMQLETSSTTGILVLGCHPSVASYTLPTFLPQLLKKYPGIEIQLFHDLSRHVVDAVLNSKVDLGFVINPAKHPDLVIQDVATDEVTFWQNNQLKDQHIQKTLIYDPNLAQTQWLLKQLHKKSGRKSEFEKHIQSTNLEVVAGLVAQGCGVGILPARVAKQYGLQKFSGVASFMDQLSLVYKPSLRKLARGKALLDILKTAKI